MSQSGFHEVDFIVREEDYSRFLLNDGTIIKAKIVLKKLLFSNATTPEGYPRQTNFDTVNAISAIVQEANKRVPSTEPFNPQQKGEEIKFQDQDVKTQEYMTSNGFRVTIKPVLSKVFKYKTEKRQYCRGFFVIVHGLVAVFSQESC